MSVEGCNCDYCVAARKRKLLSKGMNLFGESLKIQRVNKELSVREASRQLQVSPTTITNLEGGKTTDPRVSMVVKMCEFYDLKVAYMIDLLQCDK